MRVKAGDKTSSDALVIDFGGGGPDLVEIDGHVKVTGLVGAGTDAVLSSQYTVKGDILVASGPATPIRVATSTDGYVLTLDSSRATGVKWAAGTTGPKGDPGPSGGGASPPTQYTLNGATSVGAQTITLDRAPDAVVTGKTGVLVIDAYTTNCEVRLVSSVSTATVTLKDAKTVTKTTVSFDSASKQIRYTAIGADFRPGMKIVVTGSASNNGTYTVTAAKEASSSSDYIVVAESLVDEGAGVSVTIRASLGVAHANGALVLWHPGGLIPSEMYGMKASSSGTDADANTAAMQRACNDFAYSSNAFAGLKLASGRTQVSSRVLVPQSMTIEGYSTDVSILQGSSTFSFPDRNTAILSTYDNGNVAGVDYAAGNTLGRCFLRDFTIDGSNVTNANGIITAIQQPSSWKNVRVVNCPGFGIAMTGQQWVGENIEVTNCGTGVLFYGGMRFAWIRGLNIEQSSVHDFATEGAGADNNHLIDVHLESALGAGGVYFNITSGDGWIFENVWHSNLDDTGTLFKLDITGETYGRPVFTLINVRANQPSTQYLVVNDVQRGITRTSTAVSRTIQRLESGFQPSRWSLELTAAPGSFSGLNSLVQLAQGMTLGGGDQLAGVTGITPIHVTAGTGNATDNRYGSDGDIYINKAGGALTTIWQKRSGSWVGIV